MTRKKRIRQISNNTITTRTNQRIGTVNDIYVVKINLKKGLAHNRRTAVSQISNIVDYFSRDGNRSKNCPRRRCREKRTDYKEEITLSTLSSDELVHQVTHMVGTPSTSTLVFGFVK